MLVARHHLGAWVIREIDAGLSRAESREAGSFRSAHIQLVPAEGRLSDPLRRRVTAAHEQQCRHTWGERHPRNSEACQGSWRRHVLAAAGGQDPGKEEVGAANRNPGEFIGGG
jgi:hypothetical protein